MSKSNQPRVTTIESDLDRYIKASGESSHIDAKGPMKWDKCRDSAELAKDVAAFANSRDGGAVVIGKSELETGKFEYTGLTPEEAASYDTTNVARWVNNRFSPPIHLICHQRELEGKRFVVIEVAEFDEMPAICMKELQDPQDPQKLLLRKGEIYVRTANAESAPLQSVEDLRRLIGMATSKRGNEMLKMFGAMLKGQPFLPSTSDEEQLDEELERIKEGVGEAYRERAKSGGWELVVRPVQYEAERWAQREQLEEIIRRRSVRMRDVFPASQTGTAMREFGLFNDTYGESWTLSPSGQFYCLWPFWENDYEYKSPWTSNPPEPNLEAGRWVDFVPNLRVVVQMLMFVSRLVEEYEPGEQVCISLRATGLEGRKLVSTEPRVSLYDGGECRAKFFHVRRVLPVEVIRADWEEHCADTMKRFVDFFPGRAVALKTMRGWIERFRNGEY